MIVLGYSYLLLTSFPDAENSICLFKRATGIPCPGCGMGRSTWSLVHGQIKESLFYHPLGIVFNLLMIIALIQAGIDIIRNDDKLLHFLKQKWPLWSVLVLVVVILLVWGRNIWLGM
nr:DUF2752 domain-containing protein [uncultured Carboxylicivirga sp.]